jgi:predicted dehydrogenase
MGAEAVSRPDAEAAALAFTEGFGADIVLICADTTSNDPVELAGAIARDRGKVVAVGAVGLDLPRKVYFYKELDFIVSRSYGPGRYDPSYEEGGHDYPIGFIRWTAGRNLGAFVNLIGDGLLDISPLISHRFPIEEGARAYEMITGKTEESFLGVLLTYPEGDPLTVEDKTVRFSDAPKVKLDKVQLGAIGAGNFAGAVIFPVVAKKKEIELVGVASGSGRSAQHAASKYGFSYASSDVDQLIADPAVNTLAVLTRHHLHATQTLAGLRAGKHVFCEKPLALNRTELAEIEAELARPETPLLMVGYNRRFAPLAVKMMDFLKRSPDPMSLHYRVNAGFIPPEHWVHDPEQGGGRILGEGCHFIDFLAWLVGSLPLKVAAQALPDIGRYRGDNVLIQLTYPDGSVGTISYMANGDKSFSKERIEVTTGGRAAVLDDFRVLETYAGGNRRVQRSRLRLDKGHAGEWDAFTAAVLAGGPPPIPYEQLIGVMSTTFDVLEDLKR